MVQTGASRWAMTILIPLSRDHTAAVEHRPQRRTPPPTRPFLQPPPLQGGRKAITVNTPLQAVSISVSFSVPLVRVSTVMVPPPGMIVDGHYPSAVGLPTSATRLHQATWQPAPPWPGDGSQPPPPHIIHPGYPHPYYNAPPQYYRPGSMMHPDVVAQQQMPNGIGSSSNGESSSSRQGSPLLAVDPSLDHSRVEDSSETADRETVVIDPSLVSSTSSADSESRYSSLIHLSMQCSM